MEFLSRTGWRGEIEFIDSNPLKKDKLYSGRYRIVTPESGIENRDGRYILISCADIDGVMKTLEEKNALDRVLACDFTSVDFDMTPYAFIWSHIEEFEQAYGLLCDDKSRKTFVSILNYRISRDSRYLYGLSDDGEEEYFAPGLISPNISVFVDAGAYTGDTVEAFIRHTKGRYKKIISLEPDVDNYNKLISYIEAKGITNIEAYNLGAWSEKTILHFDAVSLGGGTSSHISAAGNSIVPVDCIDNIVNEKVDMIKMDIEGAEAAALNGCRRIIAADMPSLAICVYHKEEDLFEIPILIHCLCPKYQLYIRQYGCASAETVCYAIGN